MPRRPLQHHRQRHHGRHQAALPLGFHRFGLSDRFTSRPANLLLTPNERTGIFGQARYKLTDNVSLVLKGLYSTRKSVNQAAPEPIGLGAALNTSDLGLTTGVDVTNPTTPSA